MIKRFGALTMCAAIALAVTGCSTSSPPESSPTAAPLGKVSTIEDLRDAYIEAGGVCNWDQTDVVTGAVASGNCSDKSVLMLFADSADRTAAVARMGSMTEFEKHLLVGENWIINAPDVADVQEKLGGKVVD